MWVQCQKVPVDELGSTRSSRTAVFEVFQCIMRRGLDIIFLRSQRHAWERGGGWVGGWCMRGEHSSSCSREWWKTRRSACECRGFKMLCRQINCALACDPVSALIWIQQDHIVTRQTAIRKQGFFLSAPSITASMCCSLFVLYILLLCYKHLYL